MATSSTCLANQALHDQSESLASLVGPQLVAPGHRPGTADPSLFDRRSMTDWASHITVPVFISGALQDEQTGPQWPALIDALPKTTPVFANMVNGGHIDSTDPQTISRWLEFLDIYVADKVPTATGSCWQPCSSTSSPASPRDVRARRHLPAIRFTQAPNVATARAEFAAQTPLVRVLFDNGAGSAGPGDHRVDLLGGLAQLAAGRHGRDAPLRLGRIAPCRDPADAVRRHASPWTRRPGLRPACRPAATPGRPTRLGLDPGAGRRRDRLPDRPVPDGRPPSSARPPSTLGAESAAPVEDFQATITEVRPSAAQEEYVTSGFLRSSNQVDLSDSTALFTDPTYLAS